MSFIVKQPFIWSTSAYNSPTVHVGESAIPVAAALCRASLGTPEWMGSVERATDQVFPVYWRQWDEVHLPRCAYHFLKNGAGGADQAKWFVANVNEAGGFHPCDRIAVDVEDGWGEYSIREIVDCFYNIHVLVPFIPFRQFLLYSRQDIMNPLSFTKLSMTEKTMLLDIRQWPAGYPDEPDLWDYAHLARGYRMDTAKYGPVALVQYAGSALVDGLSKPGMLSIECNVAEPTYLEEWIRQTADFYGVPAPLPDVVTSPYPGVKVTTGRRFQSDIQMIEIARDAVQDVAMTAPSGCREIAQVAGDIVSNGGDFNVTTCLPVGMLRSKGVEYSPAIPFEPYLMFGAYNDPQINHVPQSFPTAVGLKRYLVVDGAQSPNTSPAWDDVAPRKIFGVRADRTLLILSVKGREPNSAGIPQKGHTLYEAAAVMLEFGALTAADADGGKSVQTRVKDVVFGGVQSPDPVADFLTIQVTQGGNPMAQYKCTVTWDSGASIRQHPTTNDALANPHYLDNQVFFASALVPDQDDPTNPSKQWAKIESDPQNGLLYAGRYVAVKYPASSGAFMRATVEDLGVTPPPPPPTGAMTVALHIVLTDPATGVKRVGDATVTLSPEA